MVHTNFAVLGSRQSLPDSSGQLPFYMRVHIRLSELAKLAG